MRASAHYYCIGGRLQHLRKIGRCHWFYEAESGSQSLGSRLRSRRLGATRPAALCRTDPFHVISYPPTPDRSYMLNEQFAWLTPRSQQEQLGLPWRNRRHENER
jgi:hypothetical protein